MTPEQRLMAGRAVSARIAELGRTAAWVQREAPVDNKTLQSLVEGARWPNHATRGKIEAVLGWPAGEIERIAFGEAVDAARPARPAEHLTDSQLIAELAMRLGAASQSTGERHDDTASTKAPDGADNVKKMTPGGGRKLATEKRQAARTED